MKRNELFEKYLSIKESMIEEGSYRALPICIEMPHRIGCSQEGYPMFFIECSDEAKTTDIKLALFKVLFNRKCSITNVQDKQSQTKFFTLIQMNSDNVELQKYFFQVVFLILQKLPVKPQVNVLKTEVSNVIQLFLAPAKFSEEVIRGLFAELLVIERSKNPEYLVRAWHVSPKDKYDFNDSIDKIEVKSTTGESRSHLFSIEQLSPNADSKLLIASIFVNQTGIGKSVFDLVESISSRLSSTEELIKLQEVVLKTIGVHTDVVAKMFFDYKMAVDTFKLYDYKSIPSIPISLIPHQVSNVRFRSDISEIASIDENGYVISGKLFESL